MQLLNLFEGCIYRAKSDIRMKIRPTKVNTFSARGDAKSDDDYPSERVIKFAEVRRRVSGSLTIGGPSAVQFFAKFQKEHRF